LRRVFSFHPSLVGGNPFQTTSIYALIHYLEREWGVHYAMGGTGALVAAPGRVFEELGGRVHLNSPVQQIVVENGVAAAVQTANGELFAADAVVVGGVSFAGMSGVRQVQVRAGRGEWANAELDTPISPYALTRWKARVAAYDANMVEARAMDGDGRWQAVEESPLFPDGVSGPTIKRLPKCSMPLSP
jgi:phytoene dehydrogenase-like protein